MLSTLRTSARCALRIKEITDGVTLALFRKEGQGQRQIVRHISLSHRLYNEQVATKETSVEEKSDDQDTKKEESEANSTSDNVLNVSEQQCDRSSSGAFASDKENKQRQSFFSSDDAVFGMGGSFSSRGKEDGRGDDLFSSSGRGDDSFRSFGRKSDSFGRKDDSFGGRGNSYGRRSDSFSSFGTDDSFSSFGRKNDSFSSFGSDNSSSSFGRRDDSFLSFGSRDDSFSSFGRYDSSFRLGGSSQGFITLDDDFFKITSPPKTKESFKEVPKDFYQEHEITTKRSQEEIKSFLAENEINVKGPNCKPLLEIKEVCLPGVLQTELERSGISKLTTIQSVVLPVLLKGYDNIGIAQTGSGKTLAFMLPAIIHTMKNKNKDRYEGPTVLVVLPTRELAQQVERVAYQYCKRVNLKTACAYGGESKLKQINGIREADIVIGTPGRIKDFVDSYTLSLQNVSYLVLDEADRMLDMGFKPAVRWICSQLSPYRQTSMWSATWPADVRALANEFISEPYVHVTVGSGDLVINKDIKQQIIFCEDNRDREVKFVEVMKKILANQGQKTLIFTNTKATANDLSYRLKKALKCNITAIHGDISQHGRNLALRDFRTGKVPVLVATDVAARGIDITDIMYVMNYDFPKNMEDYIHRCGRTGRAGKQGMAISFMYKHEAMPNTLRELKNLFKQAGQEIPDSLLELERSKGLSGHSIGDFNFGALPLHSRGGNKYPSSQSRGGNSYSKSQYGGRKKDWDEF